jgi:hypothetical protein
MLPAAEKSMLPTIVNKDNNNDTDPPIDGLMGTSMMNAVQQPNLSQEVKSYIT